MEINFLDRKSLENFDEINHRSKHKLFHENCDCFDLRSEVQEIREREIWKMIIMNMVRSFKNLPQVGIFFNFKSLQICNYSRSTIIENTYSGTM